MALGKAVVTTTVGAGGIDAVPGQHLLVEDDPRRMAEVIAGLLEDAERREAIGSEARKLVRAKYTWEKATAPLLDVVARVAGRRACETGSERGDE